MKEAIRFSKSFVGMHSGIETTFVGVAVKAIAAATANNKNAIIFNAAIRYSKFGTTQPLLRTQYWMVDKTIDFNIFGKKVYKEIRVKDPYKNHLMDAVKLGL